MRDATGPHEGRLARFAVAPQFDARAIKLVPFDKVRIVLMSPGTPPAVALDTVVDFPSDSSSITLGLQVVVEGSQQTFALTMAMINAVGDTVFRTGPDSVIASPGAVTHPTTEPVLRYVGVGWNAAQVKITSAPTAMFFGDSAVLAAEALDSSGNVIAGTPIGWLSFDTTRARIPDFGTGKVFAQNSRGPVRIVAVVPLTSDSGAATIQIQPRPSAVAAVNSGQSGTVGDTLPQRITARVTAADGLGVENVVVNFAVATGGGTLSAASAVTDSTGRASVGWRLGTGAGTQTVTATVAALTPATFSATAVAGPAKRLFFTAQPTSVVAGVAMVPAVQLSARDTFGNVATGFTGAVTVAFAANPGSATLSGTLTASAVAGVASFANLRLNRTGTGYTFLATSGALASDTSAAFAVAPAGPSRMVFQQQPPATVVAGAALSPALRVAFLDSVGNVVTGDTSTITLSIATGTTGAHLLGTKAVAAVAGVATFSGLSLDSTGANYRLLASSGTVPVDTSSVFAVTPSTPAALAFTTQPPASVISDSAFTVAVTARDSFGNVATGFAGSVALALGANPGSATLTVTTPVTAVAGVATFTGARVNKAASGYTLVASSGSMAATSTAFAVTAAVATQLAFTTQPPATDTAGKAFTIVAEARDAAGNRVTGFTGLVRISSTAAGDTLQGVDSVLAVGGVATFTTPFLRKAPQATTILATATGLTSATSTSMNVVAAAPKTLAFANYPAGSVTAGAYFTPALTVTARDTFGNVAAGFTGTVNLSLATNPGSGTLGGTSTAAVGGVATFATTSIDKVGTGYSITAAATGLPSITGGLFNIVAAVATRLFFTTQPPATDTAGQPFTVALTARDSLGNVVTTFSQSVVVSLTDSTLDTLQGTTSATASGGVATISGAFLRRVHAGVRLRATSSGTFNLSSDTSAAIAVVPAPPKTLAFTTQPPPSVVAAAPFAVAVTARDTFGNLATNSSSAVSLAFNTNPGAGTLSGTTSVALSSAVASFPGLSVNVADTGYSLRATLAGTNTPVSTTFTVVPAAASALVITTQPPGSVVAGGSFGMTVTARDASGNTATGDTSTVTLTPSTGTLHGTLAVKPTNGVATFSGLSFDTVGSYTIAAAASGLSSATSTAIAVTAGAATHLAITSAALPATDSAGQLLPITVTVRDTFNNTVTSWATPIALTLSGGTLPDTLQGTVSLTPTSGVASFSPFLRVADSGRKIHAASSTLGQDSTAAITITPASARTLAFTTQPPATAVAGTAFGAGVTARDLYGNTATGFTGLVTMALGANPDTATLGGRDTVTAVAGVANFSNLTITRADTGYTLAATAAGVTGATSTKIQITALTPTALAITTEPPASSIAGTGFGTVVTVRDSLGNTATGYTGTVSIAITGGTGTTGAALRGTLSVSAVAGVATFSGLNVDSVGTGYTLTASAAGLTSATTTSFAIVAAPATRLVFSTQPPANTVYQTGFGATVTATDSLGNRVTTFAGPVTVATGTNPAGGTLSGTLTQSAVGGVATFSGISLDNIGTGYTLGASATGLTSATSSAFNITAPAGWNAWINTAGGNWSVAGNWSRNAVPVATDSVAIKQSGTYTVTLDVNAAPPNLQVGAPLGVQTLSVAIDTLAPAKGAFGTTGTLALSGTGTVAGAPGTLTIAGAFNWTGGNVGATSRSAGTIQVQPGATLSIAPATQTQLLNDTLVLAGTGTWTGTAITNSGLGAVLRVASGGVLNVTGAPSLSLNLGGSALLQNLGTINRTTSASSFVVNVPVSGNGSWSVQSGALNLQLGGTVSGAVTVSSGAALNFFALSNTFDFDATSSVSGAGTVNLSSGTVGFRGAYNLAGSTLVQGATATFAGATGSMGPLTVSSGVLSDSGAFTVGGATTWSGGTINVFGTGSRLRLAGGSGTAFAGTATVAAGDTLDLAGGTFTLTGNLSVSGGGALVVSGGTLVPNGFVAGVAGNFGTLGTGALQMSAATDSVLIGGNATFGGGAGTLGGGAITVAGNFTQTGTTSFVPSATAVVLDGSAGQTITFASPASSFFHSLTINPAAGGATLASNVLVNGPLNLAHGTFTLNGHRAQVTGTVTIPANSGAALVLTNPNDSLIADSINVGEVVIRDSLKAGRIITGAFAACTLSTSGTFFPDTTGGLTIEFSARTVNTLNLCASGDPDTAGTYLPRVVVDAGAHVTTPIGQSIYITRGLDVSSSGSWTAGRTVFAGDSILLNGTVNGNNGGIIAEFSKPFTVLDAGRATIGGSGDTTDIDGNLSFGSSGAGSTVLAISGEVDFTGLNVTPISMHDQSDTLRVTGLMNFYPGSFIAADTALTAGVLNLQNAHVQEDNGGIHASPGGTFTLLASGTGADSVELYTRGTPFANVVIAPGSTMFTVYYLSILGDATVGGVWENGGWTDSIGGALTTTGSGILRMQQSGEVIVAGAANFGGGDETGQLTSGTLTLRGNFTQGGPTATSFVASNTHTTVLADSASGGQQVSFATPDDSLTGVGSHFGTLSLAPGGTAVQLLSDIAASGQIQAPANLGVRRTISGAWTVFTGGLSIRDLTFDQALLHVNDIFTNGTCTNVLWQNQGLTATQFYLAGTSNSSLFTFDSLTFNTQPDSGLGWYMTVENRPTSIFTSVLVTNAIPVSGGGRNRLLGSPLPTLTWNGVSQ